MNIRILSFEKHRDANLQQLEAEYLKRLSKYSQVTMEPIARKKISDKASAGAYLQEEMEILLKKIGKRDFLIILDAAGKALDSQGLSRKFAEWQRSGFSTLVFFIGGPLGIHPELKKRASFLLSLSPLTFTHEIARMLLCETMYRSFDILNGGNYHK